LRPLQDNGSLNTIIERGKDQPTQNRTVSEKDYKVASANLSDAKELRTAFIGERG